MRNLVCSIATLVAIALVGCGPSSKEVASAKTADAVAVRIAEIAERAPMRIDGEFVTPAGVGVQWREWCSPARELVAKGRDGVRLVDRAELLS